MTVKKDIRYNNKDFNEFKQSLINFARTYFKGTYNDFNESDPGTMFIEMAAYVGDVLSMYGDLQLKESLASEAQDVQNVLKHAVIHGYKTRLRAPALTEVTVYQIVPASGSHPNIKPDLRYGLTVQPNAVIKSRTNKDVEFRTLEQINFNLSSSSDPMTVSIYAYDNNNTATYYLLEKKTKAISGKVKTATFDFADPKPYDKIILGDENILDIVSITDSDGNEWKEVDYLAQDTIFESVENAPENDANLHQYKSSAPFLLKLKKTARRFVVSRDENNRLHIQFGAGVSSDLDEDIIPNTNTIGNSLPFNPNVPAISIDPQNFLFSRTYGLAPSHTTLTIKYTVGGGIKDNVPANDLQEFTFVETVLDDTGLNANLVRQVKQSLAVNNPKPAGGGMEKKDIESIRNEALAFFAAQNRCVTDMDYIVRCYTMPVKYGSVAKAFITRDTQQNPTDPTQKINNPFALNLYVLGLDEGGRYTPLNPAVKQNLKNYLSYYRMLTDAINIKDAYVIDIKVYFDIALQTGYNSNEVLLACQYALSSHFWPMKWNINQPIVLSEIYNILGKVKGVLTVTDVKIEHRYIETVGIVYDIKEATRNGVIYPSLDPSIFQIRNTGSDIIGRVVNIG